MPLNIVFFYLKSPEGFLLLLDSLVCCSSATTGHFNQSSSRGQCAAKNPASSFILSLGSLFSLPALRVCCPVLLVPTHNGRLVRLFAAKNKKVSSAFSFQRIPLRSMTNLYAALPLSTAGEKQHVRSTPQSHETTLLGAHGHFEVDLMTPVLFYLSSLIFPRSRHSVSHKAPRKMILSLCPSELGKVLSCYSENGVQSSFLLARLCSRLREGTCCRRVVL